MTGEEETRGGAAAKQVDLAQVEIPPAWRAGRSEVARAEILRERARALARPPAAVELAEVAELVSVDLGGAHFAVAAEQVREVVSLEGLAALPGTPDFVLGVLNVRGKIVAAIDLSRALGIGAPRRDWPQVMIVQAADVEVAIAADACGMTRATQRGTAAEAAPASAARYVKSVTEDGTGVLDLERIVVDTRQVIESFVGSEAP